MNTDTQKYHEKLYDGLSKLSDAQEIDFKLSPEEFTNKLTDEQYLDKLHKGLSALSKQNKVAFDLDSDTFKRKILASTKDAVRPKPALAAIPGLEDIKPEVMKTIPQERADKRKSMAKLSGISMLTEEERSKLSVPNEKITSAIDEDLMAEAAETSGATIGEKLVGFNEEEFLKAEEEYNKFRNWNATGTVSYNDPRYKAAMEKYNELKPIYDAKKKSENYQALAAQGLDAIEIYDAYQQEFNPGAFQRYQTRGDMDDEILDQKFKYEHDMKAYQHSGDALSIQVSEVEAAIGPERFSRIESLQEEIEEKTLRLQNLDKEYQSATDNSRKNEIAKQFNAMVSDYKLKAAELESMVNQDDVKRYVALSEEINNNAKRASEAMAKYPAYQEYYKQNQLKQQGMDLVYRTSPFTRKLKLGLAGIVSNVVNKAIKDVATLPQTLAGPVSNNYTFINAMADYATFHLDNYLGEYGAGMQPSNLKRGLIEKVADVDGFQVVVDNSGQVQSVRDKEGYIVGDKTAEAVAEKYRGNKRQYSPRYVTNTDVMLPATLRVVGDMGVMMLGAGLGTRLAAKAGAGMSSAQRVGLTSTVMGQTHNDAYNTAIQNGASNGEASAYAAGIASSIALIAQINPQYFVFNRNATTNMLRSFEKAYFSGAPQRVLNREKWKSVLMDGLKESIEETSEVPAEKFINGVFNHMTSGRMTLDETHNLNEYIESAALSFLPGAGFGTARHSNFSTMQQQLFVNAVQNPLEFDNALRGRIGKTTYIDGRKKKITAEDVKPIQEQVQKIRKRVQDDVQFGGLTDIQEQSITVLEARKAMLEDDIANNKGQNNAILDSKKKMIEEIDKDISKILISGGKAHYEVDGKVMNKSEFMDWMSNDDNIKGVLDGKLTLRFGNDTHAINEWEKAVARITAPEPAQQDVPQDTPQDPKKGELPGATKPKSVKTKKGLLGVFKNIFGLKDNKQQEATATLFDAVIGTISERLGINKSDFYDQVKFSKGTQETADALRKLNAQFRQGNAAIVGRDGKAIGFNYDTDMVARERFPIGKLERISAGSDRVVYDLGDGNVLKVAKTARGLLQNAAESDWFLADRGLLPGAKEVGLNYVIQPKLNQAVKGNKGYEELIAMLTEIQAVFDKNRREYYSKANRNANNRVSKNDFLRADYEFQEVLDKYGMLDLLSFDVLWGDVFRKQNWGLTDDGKAIHVDGGTFSGDMVEAVDANKVDEFTMSDFRAFKKRSMEAKEKFGDTDPYTQFQPAEKLIWRSNVQSGFDALSDVNRTPEQWVKEIQNAGGKGTAQELEWIGLLDALKAEQEAMGGGSIDKQTVQDIINANKIEIKEVTLAKGVNPSDVKAIEDKYNVTIDIEENPMTGTPDVTGIFYNGGEKVPGSIYIGDKFEIADEDNALPDDFDIDGLRSEIDNLSTTFEDGTQPKYESWTLNGGENYREILLTMPPKLVKDSYSVVSSADGYVVVNNRTNERMYPDYKTEEEANQRANNLNKSWENAKGKPEPGTTFESGHFDEPNILAHARVKSRTLSNGEKVLFIEEIQSDWAQEGRNMGFKKSDEDAVKRLEEQKIKLQDTLSELNRKATESIEVQSDVFGVVSAEYRYPSAVSAVPMKARVERIEQVRGVSSVYKFYINDVYVENTHYPQFVKKVQKQFSPQANMIKTVELQLSELEQELNAYKMGIPNMPYQKTDQWQSLVFRRMLKLAADEGFDRVAWTTGEQQAERYNLSKSVDEIGVVRREKQAEVSITLSAGRGTITLDVNRETGVVEKASSGLQDAKGKQLSEVVGKEMAEKLLNGEGRADIYDGEDLKVGGEGHKVLYNKILPKNAAKESQRFDKNAKVDAISMQIKDSQQLSVAITPEMRMNLSSAVPLFQGEQGAMLKRDMDYIIFALTNPNVSTPVHELAHIYERYLTKEEKQQILDWLKVDTWNTDVSEKFARGFEKYLADGKAPKPELQSIFDSFKDWLTKIYNGIIGSSIDLELNQNMKDIYATMLGAEVVANQGVKYTTEDGKFSLVKQDGKLRVRNNKTGVISKTHPQTKKLKDEYLNKNPELFLDGAMADIEGVANEWEAIDKVIQTSQNPREIAENYKMVVEMRKADEDTNIEKAIAENLPRLKTTTFDEHGDRNWRKDAKQITLNYLGQEGLPLDQAAQRITGSNPAFENIPEDVMMNEIIQFIKAHPAGTKSYNPKTEQETALEERFEELTGFKLTEEMANTVVAMGTPTPQDTQADKDASTEDTSEVPFQDAEAMFQDPEEIIENNKNNEGTENVQPTGKVSKNIGIIADFSAKFGKWWRKQFWSNGMMEDSAFQRMLKKNFAVNRAIRSAEYRAKEWQKAVNEEIGEPTELQLEIMSNIMKGAAKPSLMAKYPKTLNALLNMRADIDAMSNEMIKDGIVQGDIVATIQANLGIYMNRSYRMYDAPKNWWKFIKDTEDGQKIFNKAVAWIKAEQAEIPEERRLTEAQIIGQLDAFLAKNTEEQYKKSGNAGTKDISILKHRKDIPKEIRDLMGEYKNPPIEYMKTMVGMAKLINNQKFLNDMVEIGLSEGWLSKPNNPGGDPKGENIYQISPGNKAMYPLGDYYTNKDMKDALLDAEKVVSSADSIVRAYAKMNGWTKYAKTVGSPMTHARNFVGNTWFLVKNGHMFATDGRLFVAIGKANKAIGMDLKSFGSQETKDYFLKLIELGVLYESPKAGDLMEVVKLANKVEGDWEQYFDTSNMKWLKKAPKALAQLYQAEDNYWKIVAFELEKERYQKIYGDEMTEREIEEKAAKVIRDTMPTYSLVGKGVKWLSNFPIIASFPSFTAEMIRTTHNSIVLTAKEMADPQTRATGYKRFGGLVAAMGVSTLASFLSRAVYGISDDEEKAKSTFVAEYQRFAQRVYLTAQNFIDLSYSDPFSYIKQPFMALWGGKTRGEKLAGFAGEALDPFISREILITAIEEAYEGKTRAGAQVWNPEEHPVVKGAKAAFHIWKAVEPGIITSGRRIKKGIFDERTDWGKEYNEWFEALKVVTGQKVETFDNLTPVISTSFKLQKTRDRLINVKKIYRDIQNSKSGEYNAQDVAEARKDANRALRNIADELNRYYVDGNTLGAWTSENFKELREKYPQNMDYIGVNNFQLFAMNYGLDYYLVQAIMTGESYRLYIDEYDNIRWKTDEQLKEEGVK